jgi:hypothetical protein
VLSGVATDTCAQLGGAWQEQAVIDRAKAPASTNLVAMDACIAAPGVAQARQDVKEMLATVWFACVPADKIRLRQAVDSIMRRDDAVPPHQDM